MELIIGSNVIRNTRTALVVQGKEQVFLEVNEDGQLLLTMDLYDQSRKHIAKLRRNAWAFNDKDRFTITTPPGNLTRSETATGTVVVRARVLSKDRMEIPEGQFFTHKGHLLEITPDYWRIGGVTMAGNILDNNGAAVGIG